MTSVGAGLLANAIPSATCNGWHNASRASAVLHRICGGQALAGYESVGAGLLAHAIAQRHLHCLTHRVRQQAGSYRFNGGPT